MSLAKLRSQPVFLPVVVGIAIRLAGLLFRPMIDTDGAYYGAVARWFAAGHWSKALDPVWPPLYPFLTSWGVRLGLAPDAAGIAVSMLAGAVCIVACHRLAGALGGADASRTAAWLAAVHPKLVGFSLQALTESTYVALVALALADLATLGAASRPRRLAARAGVFLGFAFLTRPEAIVLTAVAVLFAAWAPPGRGGGGERAARAGACALVFALVVLPYLIHVARIEGGLTLGEKGGLNFYLTYRDHYAAAGVEARPSDFAAITAVATPRPRGDYGVAAFLRARPDIVLSHTAANLPRALFDKLPGMVSWPVFLLALAGLVWRRRIPRGANDALLGLVVVAIALSVSPFFLYRRFFVAALPPCLAWAGVAVAERRVRSPLAERIFALGVAALGVAALVALARVDAPVLYRDAGTWLARHTAGGVVVAARKPETSFYAGAEFRPLEATDLESLRDFLRRSGSTHLVVDDYILPRSHPGLAGLLDAARAPAWLRLVHERHDDRHRVLVYEFVS